METTQHYSHMLMSLSESDCIVFVKIPYSNQLFVENENKPYHLTT